MYVSLQQRVRKSVNEVRRLDAHAVWVRYQKEGMKRNLSAVIVLLSALLVSGTSVAQSAESAEDVISGDAASGVEASGETVTPAEVDSVRAAQPSSGGAPSDVQEAVRLFDAENYSQAALVLWDYLRDAEIGSPGYARAQYEIARTLVKLELYQSALLFFDEILLEGPDHPYFASSAPWLMGISEAFPGDNLMLQRLSNFAVIFPQDIEPKYHDDFAFLMGQYFYDQGELERSLEYLDTISTGSPVYNEALFLSAITDIRRYEARPASQKLIELMRILEGSRRGDDAAEELQRLTRITMARTFYSAGQYDDALRYYEQIPQESTYWLDALFESSWAYFQVDEYNRALGNLHSLNSPFFNDQYYPEAPILQAVILFYNCQFEQVRLTLDEFNYVYVPLREELEITIDSFQTDDDFFEYLQSAELQDEQAANFDPKLQQIVDATLDAKSLQEALTLVDTIEAEQRRLSSMPGQFQSSTLGSFLGGEIQRIQGDASRDGGALARERLNAVLQELREKERQASAILVETDLAEADALSADLSSELVSDASGAREITVGKDEIMWEFQGEYWRDELGHYYYRIASECSVSGADAP